MTTPRGSTGRLLWPALLLPLLLPLLAAPPAQAQHAASVEYTEVSDIEAAGFLGFLARRGGGESVRSVHVLDTKMRSDDGDASVIFDAEAAEWIVLWHDLETYMRMGLADLHAAHEEMRAAMAGRDPEALEEEWEQSRRELEEAMAEAEAEMTVSLEYVDRGESRTINGYAADRHQLVLTVEGAGDIEGAEEVDEGSLVVVMDLWLSEELSRAHPLYAGHGEGTDNPFAQALMENPEYRELAEELMGASDAGGMEDDLPVFAMVDPRVGAALGEALEELARLDGTPVRTATVVAILPPQAERDVELLLAWEPETMGDQIQGAASEAAREAARDAAREALGRATRGLLRRGGGDEEEEAEIPEEELVIQPLFRWTTEVVSVRDLGTPAPELFQIPEGYRPFEPGQPGAAPAGPGSGGGGR